MTHFSLTSGQFTFLFLPLRLHLPLDSAPLRLPQFQNRAQSVDFFLGHMDRLDFLGQLHLAHFDL